MFICLPQGIQDVGDFVSSVEHNEDFFTQTVAVCQSYNGSQWDSRLWESKNIHRQNQIKHCGSWHWGLKTRNNQSVQETEQYLYHFLPLDPPQCPTVLSVFTTSGAWRVNVLWHRRRMRGSDLNNEWRIRATDRFRACVYYAWARWRWHFWVNYPFNNYLTNY